MKMTLLLKWTKYNSMINKYEVFKWYSNDFVNGGYSCELMTNWLVIAIWKMWQLKRNGVACSKLEWRKTKKDDFD